MKRILATAAIVAMSATAFAGVSFDGRLDHFQQDTTVGSAKTSGAGAFTPTRLRATFSGKLTESISGKMQLDALSDWASTNGQTNMSYKSVNYAELTNKISDSIAVSSGRLADAYFSGWEGQTTSADQYFTSQGYMNSKRVSGLKLDYSLGEKQNLYVLVTNNEDTSDASTTNSTGNTNSVGYGLAYKAWYDSVGVMASYHSYPNMTNGTDAKNNYMTLGVAWKNDSHSLSFDYNSHVQGKEISATVDKKTNSMNAMYKFLGWGNWVPYVKAESSTVTFSAAADTTYTGTGLAVEYYPTAGDSNFRYHIAYNTVDMTTSGTKVTVQQTFLGTRFNFDALK